MFVEGPVVPGEQLAARSRTVTKPKKALSRRMAHCFVRPLASCNWNRSHICPTRARSCSRSGSLPSQRDESVNFGRRGEAAPTGSDSWRFCDSQGSSEARNRNRVPRTGQRAPDAADNERQQEQQRELFAPRSWCEGVATDSVPRRDKLSPTTSVRAHARKLR